ncbi:MAG: hypothetical protein EXS11_10960, partial [Gemmataceae bacterium]|nr:hypothetical protein [Gemmataceae bacterium]
MASFRQTCPSCEDPVLIKDLLLVGKKVDCPKCKYKFIVEPPEGEAPANAKKPPKGKAPKSKKGRNQDADDEDVDDEESDGPSKSSKKKNMVPIFVIAGVLLAVLLGGGGFLLLSGGDEDGGKAKAMPPKGQGGQVAKNEGNNADNKGDPGVGPMGDPVVPPVVAQAKPPAQGFGNFSYPNLETPDLS